MLPITINFLAHLYLGGESPQAMVGALLGDFVKGPVTDEWPAPIGAGIVLHRRIDGFTDAHPEWLKSRARFAPPLRRFAGITVDVVYDHFLARHWSRYHPEPLAHFVDRAYAYIARFEHLFPPRLARVFPYLRDENWLLQYAKFDAIEVTLTRMAQRSPRLAPLALTGPAARSLYAQLEIDFTAFFPQLVMHVARSQARMPMLANAAGHANVTRD